MLTIILNSVFQEDTQVFNEGITMVGHCETIEECKVKINEHFKNEFLDEGEEEEYELDWEVFEDLEIVQVMIKEDFGDNDMLELGYVILGEV